MTLHGLTTRSMFLRLVFLGGLIAALHVATVSRLSLHAQDPAKTPPKLPPKSTVKPGAKPTAQPAAPPAAQPASKPVETAKVASSLPIANLLSARTVFLWNDEGFEAHRAAYDKTAASDALSKTGLFQMAGQFVDSYINALDSDDIDEMESKRSIQNLLATLQSLSDQGFAVAISLPEGNLPAAPRLTIVVPRSGHLTKTITSLSVMHLFGKPVPPPVKRDEEEREEGSCLVEDKPKETSVEADPKNPEKATNPEKPDPKADAQKVEASPAAPDANPFSWTAEQIGTRQIHRCGAGIHGADMPGFDMACWDEQGHFVFVLGHGAIEQTLTLADGKAANITTHRIWKELHTGPVGFSRRSFGWIDLKEVRTVYDEIPLEGIGSLELLGETAEQIIESLFEVFEILPFGFVAGQPQNIVMIQDDVELVGVEGEPVAVKQADADVPLNPPAVDVVVPGNDLPVRAVVRRGVSVQVAAPVVLNQVPDEQKKAAEEPAKPQEAVAVIPLTLKRLLVALGLENVQHYSWQSGYKGRALWSESFLSAPGPKRGLLGLTNQPAIRLDQLPPLPVDTVAFTATSIDLKNIREAIKQLIQDAGPVFSATSAAQIEQGLKEWKDQNGKLYDNLVSSLDPLVCVYNDSTNGPLSFGPVLVWQVKDPVQLRRVLNKLVSVATAPTIPAAANAPPQLPAKAVQAVPDAVPGADEEVGKDLPAPVPPPAMELKPVESGLKVTRKTRLKREVVGIQAGDTPFGIAYVIDDKWLAVSVNTQLLEAFLLRVDGKLPRWEPTAAHREALQELPDRFTSISIDDPRKSLPYVVSLAYCGLTWIEAMCRADGNDPLTKKLLADVSNLPPGELLVQPLFPNLAVTTMDESGIHWYSRTSLPSFSTFGYVGGYMLMMAIGEAGIMNF